jgi:xanthosine utilization system XapX-like protein
MWLMQSIALSLAAVLLFGLYSWLLRVRALAPREMILRT